MVHGNVLSSKISPKSLRAKDHLIHFEGRAYKIIHDWIHEYSGLKDLIRPKGPAMNSLMNGIRWELERVYKEGQESVSAKEVEEEDWPDPEPLI